MSELILIVLGLILLFGISALFASFSDPERVDEEESRRVWRRARRARRAGNR